MELVLGGTDTLDAAVEGVKIQELDPEDNSVGYGGLPNEEGVVQLDASCMHGPTRRAGGVAALEGIKTPSEVARLVLKYTDHILLVGEGAKRFALSYGFKEEDLLTPESRQLWLEWRANRSQDDDWLDVPEKEPMVARPTGTINLDVVNAKGEISSVTTTSGLAWKIPGRVGDSPIVGAGQYTDNDVGAPAPPGGARRPSWPAAGFSRSSTCAGGWRRPMPASRRSSACCTRRRPVCSIPTAGPVQPQLLRGEQARRVRLGLVLSRAVCRERRQGRRPARHRSSLSEARLMRVMPLLAVLWAASWPAGPRGPERPRRQRRGVGSDTERPPEPAGDALAAQLLPLPERRPERRTGPGVRARYWQPAAYEARSPPPRRSTPTSGSRRRAAATQREVPAPLLWEGWRLQAAGGGGTVGALRLFRAGQRHRERTMTGHGGGTRSSTACGGPDTGARWR